MKVFTIKQPWAYLICSDLKDIENRSWPTKFRGRVLIHSSAKPDSRRVMNQLFTEQQWNYIRLRGGKRMLNKMITQDYPYSAIIGSVEIVDCVINHESIWAEKTPTSEWMGRTVFGAPKIYNWVLANPVLFAKPIKNVKGKLSFWDYPIELCHICGQATEFICKICERPYCENHQASFNQFTQFDYNCCSDCADSKKWD